MKEKAKFLRRHLIFMLICLLLAAGSLSAHAQETQSIKYTGKGDLIWDYREQLSGVDLKGVCPMNNVDAVLDLLPDGTFTLLMDQIKNFPEKNYSGGEMHCNYTATGRVLFTGTYTRNPNRLQFLQFQQQLAVNSGDGTFDDVSASGSVSAPGSTGGSLTIHLTFNVNLVQTSQPAQISSESIYTTYGIRVEDSFGDDQYTQKAWSEHELVLLNDVLKGLPPGFLKNISLDRIVRSAAFINKDGSPDPKTLGAYYPCDRKTDAKCTESKPTIRVFDLAASSTLDFPGDNDKQFKATILHELIHAYQYHKDGNTIYKNPCKSPQTLNYIEATRPFKDEEAQLLPNGWKYTEPPSKWRLYADESDVPPTTYGTNVSPLEDMAESAMMYVYDPARLKASSQERYDYILSNIFAGVEYDNGNPK